MFAHAAVYFRHCLEDLTGQAATLQRDVERLESVTLDAISLEVCNWPCLYPPPSVMHSLTLTTSRHILPATSGVPSVRAPGLSLPHICTLPITLTRVLRMSCVVCVHNDCASSHAAGAGRPLHGAAQATRVRHRGAGGAPAAIRLHWRLPPRG